MTTKKAKAKPRGAAAKHRRGLPAAVSRMTQAQVARAFGVSSGAVVKWSKRGCPRSADKTYILEAVCRWIQSGSLDLKRLPQNEMITLMGVTRPTIGAWVKAGLPRNADGTYDAAAALAWQRGRHEADLARARNSASELDRTRTRKLGIDTQLAEIELAERRNELLPRGPVVAGWVARYSTLKAELVSMVRRLAGYGCTAEQVAAVRGDVNGMLSRLAAGQVAMQLPPRWAELLAGLLAADLAEIAAAEAAAAGQGQAPPTADREEAL